ncbi:MAG: molecular chaperone DnaJ [Solirubrobacteraceae bacterium]
MPTDYYERLGIARDASETDIKKAFRRLARELHPDVNDHDPEAESKFKDAAEAYEVLSDPERRRVYDRYGADGLRSGGYAPNMEGFGSVADIFDAFFGGGGDPFGRRGGGVQGGDVAVSVEIDLAQAAAGASVQAAYDAVTRCEHCRGNGAEPGTPIETCARCDGKGQLQSVTRTPFGQMMRSVVCPQCNGDGKVPETPCSRCRGRGRVATGRRVEVDVPAGIEDGQRIRVSGRGHAGESGGPPGDLYVLVSVREDPRFIRDGDDLVTAVDVPAPLAALGTTVSVPTLDADAEVRFAAGAQPGDVHVIRGGGMPALRGGRRGDLRVVVNVVIPRRLTGEQRRLLEQLAESMTDDNLRSEEGVFSKLKRALRAS